MPPENFHEKAHRGEVILGAICVGVLLVWVVGYFAGVKSLKKDVEMEGRYVELQRETQDASAVCTDHDAAAVSGVIAGEVGKRRHVNGAGECGGSAG